MTDDTQYQVSAAARKRREQLKHLRLREFGDVIVNGGGHLLKRPCRRSARKRAALDEYVRRTGGATDPLDALTPRQREILQLVAEGHTSKDIAGKLGLSHRTVETHRNQLMKRLDIHDLSGLVRFAVRAGIVSEQG
jgi:DNA-binding CsgD family transcriptional regulator